MACSAWLAHRHNRVPCILAWVSSWRPVGRYQQQAWPRTNPFFLSLPERSSNDVAISFLFSISFDSVPPKEKFDRALKLQASACHVQFVHVRGINVITDFHHLADIRVS
eukprot:scpid90005/ scgid27314/ 